MLENLNLILQGAAIFLLVLAVVLLLIALLRSCSVFVKFLVLEVMANIFICGIALYALAISFPVLLDICLALSLIAFLSTAAYCQFIAVRGKTND